MQRKYINKIILVLTICTVINCGLINKSYAASKANSPVKSEKTVDQSKKEDKKDNSKVKPDNKAQEMEQIYPVLICWSENGTNTTINEYVNEKTLDKLYKLIGDNENETYSTVDDTNIISFDSQTAFKLTAKVREGIKKMADDGELKELNKAIKYTKVSNERTDTYAAKPASTPEIIGILSLAFIVMLAFYKYSDHT